jgi:tetratricopeptide (TPR) repeat protein
MPLDTAQRVTAFFDRYGVDWSATRTRACEATRIRGEASVALMDTRVACLDRALQKIDALTALFERADAQVVKEAVKRRTWDRRPCDLRSDRRRVQSNASARLGPGPRRCGDAADDRRARGVGRHRQVPGCAATRKCVTRGVAQTIVCTVRAEALFGLAKAALWARNVDAALADLEQATLAALRGRHDQLLPRIWILKARAEADRKHWDDSLRASEFAESAAEALGDPRVEIEELGQRGSALSGAGRHAAALDVLGRAIPTSKCASRAGCSRLGKVGTARG